MSSAMLKTIDVLSQAIPTAYYCSILLFTVEERAIDLLKNTPRK